VQAEKWETNKREISLFFFSQILFFPVVPFFRAGTTFYGRDVNSYTQFCPAGLAGK